METIATETVETERSPVTEVLEHTAWLKGVTRHLVGAHAADDVVQDVWIACIRNPPLPDGEEVRGWLQRVALNRVRMEYRSQRRRLAREAVFEDLRQPNETPEDCLVRAQLRTLVARKIASVPEPYGETLRLRYYEGLATAEIARRLGVPEGTVRRRIKVAVDRLRESTPPL
jgi:RNA polymerase sigma-70 factor (ECF subfamily)